MFDTPLPSHTPDSILRLLGTRAGKAYRGNCSGASVFRLEDAACGDCFFKAMHRPGGGGLAAEHEKLTWLKEACAGIATIPPVLAYEEAGDWSYLVTQTAPGAPGHQVFSETPLRVARLMGLVLKALHECPVTRTDFHIGLADLLTQARQRVEARRSRPHGLHSLEGIRLSESPEQRLARLEQTIPTDEQHRHVITHGDYCLPNVLLELSDTVSLVDVGGAAIADRHRDLALGVRSIRYNGGMNDAVEAFVRWYGTEQIDPRRLRFWGDLLELV